MAKAKLSIMEQLHEKLAETMLDQLRGEEISPAMLSSIAKFLKDNHIECTGGDTDVTEFEKALKEMNDLPYDGEVTRQ